MMQTTLAAAADLMTLFADETRLRLTALLEGESLTVAELVSVTQLAQSRVSSHLARLRDADVLFDRRVGAATFYALNASMPDATRKVWELLRSSVADATLASDERRRRAIVDARKKARRWPDDVAGEMDRHWSPGRTWESLARSIVPLLDLGDVLDVGCGDGAVAKMLAPSCRSIVGVDQSEKLVGAARARFARSPDADRVRFDVADAHHLPYPDAHFDAVLVFHLLVHAEDPAAVLAECARVARHGARIVVVTLDGHDDVDLAASYGHRHRGFPPAALKRLLRRAHLDVASCAVTARDRRPPNLQVVTALARRPARKRSS